MFPRDLKVSHFQSSNIVSQWGRRHTKDPESKCIHHLVLPTQSAKSQTTQAPSNITEKSAMACCRRTSRVQQRNRLGWECLSRSRLSGFLAEFSLASYLGDEGTVVALHFLAEQNSQSGNGERARRHLQHPDSSPQPCDVNANDISAMANM